MLLTDNPESTEVKILKNAILPGHTDCYDLSISKGRISALKLTSKNPDSQLVLPAFYEPHVHANRAFRGSVNEVPSLKQAIEDSLQDRSQTSAEEFGSRAYRLFNQAISHGVQSIRTHTDVDPLAGLRAIQGLLAAREQVQGKLDVDIIAFATSLLDPAETDAQRLLQQAIKLGANTLGAVPAFYENPEKSIDQLLTLAAANGLTADFHLDEHLDSNNSLSEYLADATIRFGLQGKVSLSHGCAISELTSTQCVQLIDKLAKAEITVITMPATNLYVQDRQAGSPSKRGTTRVKELINGGIKVLIGSDNVQDYFYPYGNADPLESAYLTSLSCHLDKPLDLLKGICNGKAGIQPGDPADLVVIPASSIQQALAIRPEKRLVIRQGKVIANANTEPR